MAWLYKRTIKLFGKERLEQWKDHIASYWEKNIEKIDEAQLLQALSRMYGRREGKKILRLSRSEHTQRLVAGEEEFLIGRFTKKLATIAHDPQDHFTTTGLTLEEHDYSTATIFHEGHTYYHEVAGLIAITGTVLAEHHDGTASSIQVFSRWITHHSGNILT